MNRVWIISVGIITLLFSLAIQAECISPYRGQTIDVNKLKTILSTDKKPINLCDTYLHGLNLSNLDLSDVDLSGADISESDLSHANLSGANLTKTYFQGSNLTHANLKKTNLEKAILERATLIESDLREANLSHSNLSFANLTSANIVFTNLEGANLREANLEGANLAWANLATASLLDANLTDANLENANLTEAKIIKTQLRDANFDQVDLDKAIFEPNLKALPNLTTFTTVKDFEYIEYQNYNNFKASLTEIRNAYKVLGIRSMERTITATIKYQEMITAWHKGSWSYIESGFNYIFFYLTCDYGAEPGRPLRLFLIGIFLFAIPYRYALSKPTKHAGIVAIWTSHRLQGWDKCHSLKQSEQMAKLLDTKWLDRKNNFIQRQFHLIKLTVFFSMLSAFSIGWKDINVSNWISHLQAREFTLKGKGWVRALAGFQSLFSAYMIVMWVFTYFFRPFEW
jgi:uncharacterized protein YjbI with pentapeptide repeats